MNFDFDGPKIKMFKKVVNCLKMYEREERIDGNNSSTIFTADFSPSGQIKRQPASHGSSPRPSTSVLIYRWAPGNP